MPCIVKTALHELKLSDLFKAVSVLKAEVSQLKRNLDHPFKPGPEFSDVTTSKHHVVSDKANTSTENVCWSKQGSGDVSYSAQVAIVTREKKKIEVKTGTLQNTNIKGIARLAPMKFALVGGVPKECADNVVRRYCDDNPIGLLHVQKVSFDDPKWNFCRCVSRKKTN